VNISEDIDDCFTMYYPIWIGSKANSHQDHIQVESFSHHLVFLAIQSDKV